MNKLQEAYDRLQIEKEQLKERIYKLRIFLDKQDIDELIDETEKNLLSRQLQIMVQYNDILCSRSQIMFYKLCAEGVE